MNKPVLTYLFEAEFTDGSTYTQNPEDASLKFPPLIDEDGNLQGKSCYTDIVEDVEQHRIRKFSLIGHGNVISVDLKDGIFEVNGVKILVESKKLPILPEYFELIYYRQVNQDQNVTVNKKTLEVVSVENMQPFIEYFIGWKTNIAGQEYIQKIAVA